MDDTKKKSTYNAEVQKRYNTKRNKFTANCFNDEYEAIKAHYTRKGFTSANSYILSLIRADMSTAAEAVGAVGADDDTKDC